MRRRAPLLAALCVLVLSLLGTAPASAQSPDTPVIDVVQLSGSGTVYSYAVLHHPQNPAFDYPVLAALVDLDEGIRIVSNLTGIEPDDILIGMRVEAVFEPTVGDCTVPVFRPMDLAS